MPRKKKTKIEQDLLKEVLTDEPFIRKDTDLVPCRIKTCFHDKYTDQLYEVGKIYTFTYKRVKEIQAKNEKYIEIVE